MPAAFVINIGKTTTATTNITYFKYVKTFNFLVENVVELARWMWISQKIQKLLNV